MTGINDKKGTLTETEDTPNLDTPATLGDIQDIVNTFNQVLQARDQQDYDQQEDLTKAFMMINQAIAALNAKSEVISEHFIAKGELSEESVTEALKTKLEEAAKMQHEALEKAIKQQKEQAELAAKEA